MYTSLVQEMEHQLDRITLYKDFPTEAQLEVTIINWKKQLETKYVLREDVERTYCAEHDEDLQELREALADAEERIRQAKEIL